MFAPSDGFPCRIALYFTRKKGGMREGVEGAGWRERGGGTEWPNGVRLSQGAGRVGKDAKRTR